MKPTRALADSPEAFRRFLAWLDQGADSRGEAYLEIRRRLVSYFARRRCVAPDDLADETLNRAARRLHEEGEITQAPPAAYCYIVARYVFLEHLRDAGQRQVSLQDPARPHTEPAAPADEEIDAARERTLACFERCLDRLARGDHELILRYYRGERQVKIRQRQELAAGLGLTAAALRIRACRIRNRLEACIGACRAGDDMFTHNSSYRE